MYVKGEQEHIFAPISGPSGTKAKLMKILFPVLEKLKTKCIISLGTPGKKITAKIGDCELHTWLSAEERQEYMKNAKFVIFSGGHITCFETIKYAKPSICIPTQSEQLGNAAKLQDLNCSITVKNKNELEKAVEKMQKKKESFDRNMLTLNKFSNRFRGIDRAVMVIESLLD
jgi:UDP:flavonoid glycosyltransferase YjiC (YdhE family)